MSTESDKSFLLNIRRVHHLHLRYQKTAGCDIHDNHAVNDHHIHHNHHTSTGSSWLQVPQVSRIHRSKKTSSASHCPYDSLWIWGWILLFLQKGWKLCLGWHLRDCIEGTTWPGWTFLKHSSYHLHLLKQVHCTCRWIEYSLWRRRSPTRGWGNRWFGIGSSSHRGSALSTPQKWTMSLSMTNRVFQK